MVVEKKYLLIDLPYSRGVRIIYPCSDLPASPQRGRKVNEFKSVAVVLVEDSHLRLMVPEAARSECVRSTTSV